MHFFISSFLCQMLLALFLMFLATAAAPTASFPPSNYQEKPVIFGNLVIYKQAWKSHSEFLKKTCHKEIFLVVAMKLSIITVLESLPYPFFEVPPSHSQIEKSDKILLKKMFAKKWLFNISVDICRQIDPWMASNLLE